MKDTFKAIAKAAGAVTVIYDRLEMQNILADKADKGLICLLKEIDSVDLTVDGNGVSYSVKLEVAFVKDVSFQDTAENNDPIMNTCLTACRKFLLGLVDSGLFNKDITSTATKQQENEFDANLIGWGMTLTLKLRNGYSEC